MRQAQQWAAGVILVLLVGCSQKEESTGEPAKEADAKPRVEVDASQGSVSISAGSGASQVHFSAGGAAQAPSDLPSYAPVYPGATVESVMSGQQNGASAGMLTLATADAPEKVAAFYRPLVKGTGFKQQSEANMNGTLMLSATTDEKNSVAVAITPRDGGGSSVHLTYAAPTKP